jgi:peroxiredoxin
MPTVVGSVDTFGDPIADHSRIGNPNPFPGALLVTDAVYSALGSIVNPDLLVATLGTIKPSHIQGVAQLQLFPPTVAVPDASGTNLTVRMNIMARFFPDKNTAPLAEFIRGDLQITAPVNKIASGKIHVVDIDFKADDAIINFTPSYSSQTLSPEDLAGVNLCIKNGLRTSFLPSSVNLPSSVADVQLKTLPGAIAVVLDVNDHPSSVASVTNVFLQNEDDFAFAAGRDYLLNAFRAVSNNLLSRPFPPATFTVSIGAWGVNLTTLHFTYPITLNSASFDLQAGRIVLTVQGHADQSNHSWAGPFDFTVTVDFSLQAAGPTVDLIVGNISVDTNSTIAEIVDFFTNDVTNSVRNVLSGALAATNANTTINNMFNADTNLGQFLTSQLTPPANSPQNQSQRVFLVYNSIDIQPAGIVAHGSLLLFDWPAPHVEFEQIPSNSGGPLGPIVNLGGPDYSALKTWIPGGTILQYEWSSQGQEQAYPFSVDPNKFVLLHSGPEVSDGTFSGTAVTAYTPLCLTIKGNRISNFGSPVYQSVSATVCGFTRIPVISVELVSALAGAIPMLALTAPGPGGQIVVTGHAMAQVGQTGGDTPNLIVHFGGAKSAGQLQLLTRALAQNKPRNAATSVLAVLASDQLAKVPYTQGIIYSEDQDGAWARVFGVKTVPRPLTLIVTPKGSVAWQHEGPLDEKMVREELAPALEKHLAPHGPVRISMPRLNVRIGHPAPNFLFEFAPGRELPLRKLVGRPAVLVFWKSGSNTSIDAVRHFQNGAARAGSQTPVVLAINDGEAAEVARGVAAESGLSATLVTDPQRRISLGYGVNLWPTVVFLDAAGLVSGIRYGHGEKSGGSPSKETIVA